MNRERARKPKLGAIQISDFDPWTDKVVRLGHRTFIVSPSKADMEVATDVITPEVIANLKGLTPEQRIKMREAIKVTYFLSSEGKAERLAVLDECEKRSAL